MAKPARNRGVGNFHNRLTEIEVMEIVKSDKKQSALAEQYKVQQSTINHIIKGRTWSWLTGVVK